MAKSKSELRKWLDGLAIEAADQTRLYDSSINKLYHCLSSLYMWWREAKQYEGFLDELYDEFNITTRRKNEENFVRVIRLMEAEVLHYRSGVKLSKKFTTSTKQTKRDTSSIQLIVSYYSFVQVEV